MKRADLLNNHAGVLRQGRDGPFERASAVAKIAAQTDEGERGHGSMRFTA